MIAAIALAALSLVASPPHGTADEDDVPEFVVGAIESFAYAHLVALGVPEPAYLACDPQWNEERTTIIATCFAMVPDEAAIYLSSVFVSDESLTIMPMGSFARNPITDDPWMNPALTFNTEPGLPVSDL